MASTHTSNRRPVVAEVGPGPGSAGGIRSVIAMLVESDLAARFELVEVHTHRDGGAVSKLAQAARGIGGLAVLLARRRIDLVHLHTASDASFRRKAVAAALARIARRPYVLHVHGGGFADYAAGASAVERALIRRTLRGAARVVALSPSWEQRLLDITPCATVVIPNPVREVEAAADVAARPARIVCLGRLGDDKGSRLLVRALAGMRADATLCLAGDGDAAPVRAEAERLGVSARVSTPGWVDATRRDEILATATIFALPSRVEGLPMALLEAMAHGLPVVVTPVGGVPDVVGEGDGAITVPVDDPEALAAALDEIAADPARATRMGARNRARVAERYAIRVVAERLADTLDRALGATGR